MLFFVATTSMGQKVKPTNDTNKIVTSSDFSKAKKLKKIFAIELNEFNRIPKSRVVVEYGAIMKFTKGDEHALAGARSWERTVETSEFFLNTHEVTNREYRAFVDTYKNIMLENGSYDTLVRDHPVWYFSSNRQYDSIDIQVRSKLWVDEMTTHMGEPMMEYYFSHSDFDNYPVVGITYEQCLAFIEWKNEQFTAKLRSIGFDEPWGAYRVPTRDEWVTAAGSKKSSLWWDDNQSHKRLYPFDGSSFHYSKNGLYKANFGGITDQNGLYIKGFYEDGYMYTAPIKSYHSNDYGLYDMAGNVSEWTSTVIAYDSLDKFYKSYYELSSFKGDTVFYEAIKICYPDWEVIDSLVELRKTYNAMWTNPNNTLDIRSLGNYVIVTKIEKPMETHNLKLLEKYPQQNIVKGGNWLQGPLYMLLSSEQAYHKEEASTSLGMRLALDLNPEVLSFLGAGFGVHNNKKTKR
jgi:formylglycine-generating enzyme required for sulfatase activity